jgi:cellulose synthase/poly-beta-1,6-N-acetylglucosamine synthase-like glycosyltransferase
LADTAVSFSVVVATHNRPASLERCLRSLAQLDYPREALEVIVVDDGSDTPLDSIVDSVSDGLDVELVTQPPSGPATARNTGVAKSSGTFVAFTDDDCTPAPDWLAKLTARLSERPDLLVGGLTINALTRNTYATASQTLIGYLYSYYNAAFDQASFLTSNNMAFARRRFDEVGGFDTSIPRPAAEDRELCDRWLYNGLPMLYASEAIVYHYHDLTPRRFWRQQFGYGRGAYYFHVTRARRGEISVKIEPPAFYVDLFRYPFMQLPARTALKVAPLLGVAQVANAAGFFWERRSRRKAGGAGDSSA